MKSKNRSIVTYAALLLHLALIYLAWQKISEHRSVRTVTTTEISAP